MATDFRSANWYRVAGVKPRLAPHVTAQRQVFRGAPWYVLFDPINQRTHRLTPQAWQVVSRMDGQRSVDQLWQDAAEALGADAPAQDELIQLMAQLHESDILLSDVLPDLDELVRRRDRQRTQLWKRNLSNPLSIRLRLWDPDAFLTRTLPAVRWVFGPWGLLIWLVVCVPALVLAGMHWHELGANLSDRLLSASSLLTMLLVYPVVKALHEMAHAYAAKAGGAAVHDMGLMFLIFAPVPYVDASGSSAFADKRQRALVAAAGMLMEIFLGALALHVWLVVEPGLVRSLAFSVMVIGGASTLLFNGNPLLRYDGYYVLSDWIESPNLAQRSNQFWQWLIRRHAFGLTQAQAPQATPGERRWHAAYAPLSLFYRVYITINIALFLGKEYLYVGLGIGLWGLVTMLVWPMLKGVHYVWASPELVGRRLRPAVVSAVASVLLLVLVLAVPMPMSSYAQGVVWPAQNAQIRAAESGFVTHVALRTGDAVHAGDVAALMANDQLETDRNAALARNDKEQRSYVASLAQVSHEPDEAGGRVKALVQAQEWQRAQDDLAHAENQMAGLSLAVKRDGRLELPRSADLPGRWLKKGELVGHVVTGDAPTVRVVVTQDDIDLVRARLQRIEVLLSGDLRHGWPAKLVREVPEGDEGLPSMALSLDGGGLIPVAADGGGQGKGPGNAAGQGTEPHALNRIFQFDIVLPPEARGAQIGERAHVRFVHESESLASQLMRRVRQLLLSQLTL